MNNKGQTIFYGLMLGITILVLALALSPAVRDFTTGAMNDTVSDTIGLNCSGTTDNFIKATCIVTDMSLFYFIGILVFMAGAVVTAKFLIGGGE
jgi:cellobiose-specific phosphotransferase system component IIC